MIKSILVLDDNDDLCYLFKIGLQSQGISVFSFTNPLLALEYYKKHPNDFSLVLTDLRMPVMCGLEFANAIRKIHKEIEIWLMSAYILDNIENNPNFVSANISKVIEKPIDIDELTNLIKTA